MKRFKTLLLFFVYLFIALTIYFGVTFVPKMETKRTRMEQQNYFLGLQTGLISSPTEKVITRNCKSFITELESGFRQELTRMATNAYREYQTLKAENPETSPYSLAGKYMRKVRLLEEKYDSRFEDYIDGMERKFKSKSLSIELVDHARYAYHTQKRNIKQEFYNKGKKLVENN
ncbi:MAG: hypothetical protein FH756_07395 [Firmicutes bacterium]|nr:hypothetical protein [Bacillota bacterium]